MHFVKLLTNLQKIIFGKSYFFKKNHFYPLLTKSLDQPSPIQIKEQFQERKEKKETIRIKKSLKKMD